ncbi:MAG: YitT family protein [Clostridia bacterium]|nr:YitT family protein [Clostridia bacterium]MBQ7051856.1 YitT family protein [Clostridia bacterium]
MQFPKGVSALRIFLRKSAIALLGSAILAFGLYNVHAFSGVTEGGILGVSLFLHHWFGISPALTNLILNSACYLFGLKTLGKTFILYSFVAGGGFSLFYAIFEQFPPLWPGLSSMPLLAAVVGALFVGVGIGLSVRAGGAPGGDDALAMTLGQLFHQPIERIYLISDLTALALCSTYLPLPNIACSLLTVVLSGQIIGLIQRIPAKRKNT